MRSNLLVGASPCLSSPGRAGLAEVRAGSEGVAGQAANYFRMGDRRRRSARRGGDPFSFILGAIMAGGAAAILWFSFPHGGPATESDRPVTTTRYIETAPSPTPEQTPKEKAPAPPRTRPAMHGVPAPVAAHRLPPPPRAAPSRASVRATATPTPPSTPTRAPASRPSPPRVTEGRPVPTPSPWSADNPHGLPGYGWSRPSGAPVPGIDSTPSDAGRPPGY
jgi:hypothetical protein